ncbi:MAG: hypothetical protein HC888_19970 [Candidatus Competibacteraceae bacterium]|nr:hypothetical protein [Candidatus Competibacteraceae bacterium]
MEVKALQPNSRKEIILNEAQAAQHGHEKSKQAEAPVSQKRRRDMTVIVSNKKIPQTHADPGRRHYIAEFGRFQIHNLLGQRHGDDIEGNNGRKKKGNLEDGSKNSLVVGNIGYAEA